MFSPLAAHANATDIATSRIDLKNCFMRKLAPRGEALPSATALDYCSTAKVSTALAKGPKGDVLLK